ncbi:MAG: glycosyltransferase [Candidatus Paceibacterota bacterium]
MISIIIPTLNEEKTIENTLRSLKELRDYDYEIIVSDGRSKDQTVEIAKRHGAKVVVYNSALRQTISNGRNLGASVASGGFFIFIDADVIIPDINNFFKKALSLFDAQKKLVGLTVRIKVLPEVETLADKIIFSVFDYLNFFSNNILGFGGASGEFQMIRASVFKKLKGYNEKITVAEDVDMFYRLAREGKTRIEMSLKIIHTGRRAHKVGWPKLLWSWSINGLWNLILKRSFHNIWEEIR